MRVGMWTPYLAVLGGGERYFLTAAKFFQDRGDEVEIFGADNITPQLIIDRFGLNLDKVNFVNNNFAKQSLINKLRITQKYDLFYFFSDGSIPSSLAKANLLVFQAPFHFNNQKTLLNKIKLLKINHIFCYSQYVKKFIDKTYGIDTAVLYPPVEVNNFIPGKKENIIISVGRFSSPPHSKNQEVLIDVFKKMVDQSLTDWRLVLIGGTTPEDQALINNLKKISAGYPINILENADFKTLINYYSLAKIYWHAAGFGQDLESFPEKAEHFGITTVEAMAAGCVPVVFEAGGQLEIVEENKSGLFWKSTEELTDKTLNLITSENKLQKFSQASQERAQYFSQKNFFQRFSQFVPKN